MIKRVLLFILALLICGPVYASKQVTFGGHNTSSHATNTLFLGVHATVDAGYSTTNRSAAVAAAGTFSKMRVKVGTAPGAGKSYTFTLQKNEADTDVVVTISGTDTQGSDLVNTSAFSAGDTIGMKLVPTNSPATHSIVGVSVEFVPTTANQFLLMGSTGAGVITAASNPRYFPIHGYRNDGTGTEISARTIMTAAGTIKNLYVSLSGAVTSGTSHAFTIFKNGSATDLVVTITGTGSSGSNTTDEVSVVAGDQIVLERVRTGTASDAVRGRFGVMFIPTASTQSAIAHSSFNTPSTSATNYTHVVAGGGNFSTTEANHRVMGQNIRIKKMQVIVDAAPGSGKSYTYTVVKDGVDTAIAGTIADTATTLEVTQDLDVSDFESLSIKIVPASTPASGRVRFGFLTEPIPAPAPSRRVFLIT